jgi:hypothetical protein
MCDQCVEPEQISETEGIYHLHNAPHPLLKGGQDR